MEKREREREWGKYTQFVEKLKSTFNIGSTTHRVCRQMFKNSWNLPSGQEDWLVARRLGTLILDVSALNFRDYSSLFADLRWSGRKRKRKQLSISEVQMKVQKNTHGNTFTFDAIHHTKRLSQIGCPCRAELFQFFSKMTFCWVKKEDIIKVNWLSWNSTWVGNLHIFLY